MVQVEWFWEVLKEASAETRLRILTWTTGLARAPLGESSLVCRGEAGRGARAERVFWSYVSEGSMVHSSPIRQQVVCVRRRDSNCRGMVLASCVSMHANFADASCAWAGGFAHMHLAFTLQCDPAPEHADRWVLCL